MTLKNSSLPKNVLKRRLIEIIPSKTESKFLHDFYIYLLEFLDQEIVIDDDLQGKLSQEVTSMNFGLLCAAAIDNLKHNFWNFIPPTMIDITRFTSDDYEYLKNGETMHLISEIYSPEESRNFKKILEATLKYAERYVSRKKMVFESEKDRFEFERKRQKTVTLTLFLISWEALASMPFPGESKNEYSNSASSDSNSQQFEMITCSACEGVGKINQMPGFNSWVKCTKCEGSGEEKRAILASHEMYCAECNGSGKVNMMASFGLIKTDLNFAHWTTCTKCDGKGKEKNKQKK